MVETIEARPLLLVGERCSLSEISLMKLGGVSRISFGSLPEYTISSRYTNPLTIAESLVAWKNNFIWNFINEDIDN